jgi:hypothetical protein
MCQEDILFNGGGFYPLLKWWSDSSLHTGNKSFFHHDKSTSDCKELLVEEWKLLSKPGLFETINQGYENVN